MTLVNTTNSTYEIDYQNQRIRRLSGVNEPTAHFSPDGEWKDFTEIASWGSKLCVYWPDGQITLTTIVTDTEEWSRPT